MIPPSDQMMSPRGERFPKWIRLRKRAEFIRVNQGGRQCARRFLVVYALERETTGLPTRAGFTASRKIGKSTIRNRTRRMLREVFRRLHHELLPGFDVVINARMRIVNASLAEIENDLRQCLKNLNLLKNSPMPSTEQPSGDS